MGELVESVSKRYAAGDDLELEFTVTLDDAELDITGMTPRFSIVRRHGAEPVISTTDGSATATLTAPTDGVFQVAVAGAETEGLSGTYRFEAELEDSGGDIATVSRGFITFTPALINASTA